MSLTDGIGLVGLPSAIDIEKFVESRAFEISAMQTAMKTARLAPTGPGGATSYHSS